MSLEMENELKFLSRRGGWKSVGEKSSEKWKKGLVSFHSGQSDWSWPNLDRRKGEKYTARNERHWVK